MSTGYSGLTKAPDVSQRLEKVFAEFDQAGIKLTRQEIAWLALLAEKADRPLENGVPWLADAPLVYGGDIFWPLTQRARSWFQFWYSRFEDSPEIASWLYVFASVNSRPGNNALRSLSDWHDISDAVRDYGASVNWPVQQLPAVIDKILQLNNLSGDVPSPNCKRIAQHPINVDNINAALAKAYPGTTPEYWDTCVSIVKRDQLMRSLRQLNDENGSDPDSPKDRALQNFYTAKTWIRQWHGEKESLNDGQST